MKVFILLLALLPLGTAFGASITVEPFSIKFQLDTQSYEPVFELEMACRYEKFVIGDSAQYEYKFKKVPLKVTNSKLSPNLKEVEISNPKKMVLEMKGYFKTNKECQTITKFFLKSKLYSIGWANQFHRPIKLGIYKQSRLSKTQVFDSESYRDLFESKELGFTYKDSHSQSYVKFSIDEVPYDSMSTYARIMVPLDPKTKKPYLLK